MKSLLILGRQPTLGLAELESLYGASDIMPIGTVAAGLAQSPELIDFKRLGASTKLARVLTSLPTASWSVIESYLSEASLQFASKTPKGSKMRLGLSVFGIKISSRDINASSLRLKKSIKTAGYSVRVVPNKYPVLNSAQVIHNQLTGPSGCEFVIVRHGAQTIVAQTITEQNIEAYAERDQARPMRDAKVGMLPPKLAQLLINLANPPLGSVVLDPFCGTGVVLQEALLMGYSVYGTDLEPRMVDYSKANIEWLHTKTSIKQSLSERFEPADATTFKWQLPFHTVAAETYLGKPLTSLPPQNVLAAIIKGCDDIHTKFLSNLAGQIPTGTTICLAVPAWKTKNGFLHLDTLDRLEKMGYTRKKFVHAPNHDLIYHRTDQFVGRELVVLAKK
jgi:tRNA (guanine10-N2)-dimethyltransferase